MLITFKDDGHIRDKKTYEEIVDCLEHSNKQGYGERWSVDKIKKSAHTDKLEEAFIKYVKG